MFIDPGTFVTKRETSRATLRRRMPEAWRPASEPATLVQALALALITVGIGLRLAEYGLNRSLWLDEAFLALNIRDRGFGDLFGTLDYNQAAPAGYLLLERSAVALFGDTEYALRAIAVIAACASVPLFWISARRVLATWPAILALGLFALSGGLLLHAAEVKPYSSDVLVSVALLTLAVARWPQGELTLPRSIAAGLVGGALVWVSYPAVFVVAGIGATLLVEAILRGARATVRNLVVTTGLALGSAAILSATVLDSTVGVQTSLKAGVPRFFLPFPPTSAHDFAWFPRAARSFFRESVGLGTWAAVLFAALALVGAVSLARRGAWRTVGILLSPLPFVLAASAAGLYPFGGRFTLFYVPFILLLVAQGAWAVVETMQARFVNSSQLRLTMARTLGASLCGLGLLAVAANSAFAHFEDPQSEAIKPALAEIQDQWRPGDSLYLYFASQYAFRYYAECDDCGVVQRGEATSLWSNVRLATPSTPEFAPAVQSSPPAILVGVNLKDEPLAAMESQLDHLPRGRLWVLFTHLTSQGTEALETTLRKLDEDGKRLAEQSYDGAVLYLYDVRSE